MIVNKLSLLLYLLMTALPGVAQQVPDTTYRFEIRQSAYQMSEGPLVLIDEYHNNLHTRNGGFRAFSMLLEQDGYRTEALNRQLTALLTGTHCDVLVIANALHASNIGNWTLPTPSAFTEEEIDAILKWVNGGGKLLLIADHMPYAGAANDLASAFGFSFLNGFAITGDGFWPPSDFSIENGGLPESAIIQGNNDYERIASIATFTGSAFKIPEEAIPIIQFDAHHFSLQPDTAWRFNENTPKSSLEHHYQGALLSVGKGKVAVFGEAAMFTAQLANGTKAGFNSPHAPNNAQFVLNLMHWLDGVDKYTGPAYESEDDKEILLANKRMVEAFQSNDFQKLASIYGDKAVMVGNKHQVIGRKEIDEYWMALKDRGISWELENIHLECYDGVAVQRGISRMQFLHDGKAHLSEVRFTLIWKKIDGVWKIEIDHYSLL